MAPQYTKVQVRRGTAAQWTQYNTALDVGEIGFETDTNKFKIGNADDAGETIKWKDLPYFGSTTLRS